MAMEQKRVDELVKGLLQLEKKTNTKLWHVRGHGLVFCKEKNGVPSDQFITVQDLLDEMVFKGK